MTLTPNKRLNALQRFVGRCGSPFRPEHYPENTRIDITLRVLCSRVRSSEEIMTREPPTDKPLAPKNSVHTLH